MFFVAGLPAVMVLAMFGVLPSWALACTAAAAGLLFVGVMRAHNRRLRTARAQRAASGHASVEAAVPPGWGQPIDPVATPNRRDADQRPRPQTGVRGSRAAAPGSVSKRSSSS